MTFRINGLFVDEIESSATVAGCIEVYENIWPNYNETIELVEKECANEHSGVYWEKASTIGHGQAQNIRTNKIIPITHQTTVSDNKVLRYINNQFYMTLLSATNSYAKKFRINEQFYHEGYNLLKYSTREEYKAHYDGSTAIARAISAVCYLNADYEGGEIEFVNFKVKIKPEPGMLILFPSNYAYNHIAHPVTSGTKYALVTWIRDRQ